MTCNILLSYSTSAHCTARKDFSINQQQINSRGVSLHISSLSMLLLASHKCIEVAHAVDQYYQVHDYGPTDFSGSKEQQCLCLHSWWHYNANISLACAVFKMVDIHVVVGGKEVSTHTVISIILVYIWWYKQCECTYINTNWWEATLMLLLWTGFYSV